MVSENLEFMKDINAQIWEAQQFPGGVNKKKFMQGNVAKLKKVKDKFFLRFIYLFQRKRECV